MKQPGQRQSLESSAPPLVDGTDEVLARIRDAIASVRFGSVEVVIQDSRVVQIERTEKFRFDRPR
jgi:hypothetical protein